MNLPLRHPSQFGFGNIVGGFSPLLIPSGLFKANASFVRMVSDGQEPSSPLFYDVADSAALAIAA
ncbi:MAG: hypothetical protein ACTFAK_09770 [Candidatus Electronema sp. VV]